jgi:nitrous oxide reductase accessory protein NosL
MMKLLLVVLVAVALLSAGCKSNNDQKPVYFVPPTAIAA